MRAPALQRLFGVVLLALTAMYLASAAEPEKMTYYVQLIRGNNDDKPPVPGAKRIGLKLANNFRPIFKWESYWEINRQRIELAHGQKSRLKLSKEREVEIDLTEAGKRKVTVYSDGREVSRATRLSDEAMTIIGGDRDTNSVWFIVVRRDEPTDGDKLPK